MTPLKPNSRGSTIIQVLVATTIMSISFYYLSNYVIAQKNQINKNINVLSLHFALNSTMDYVIFGIRQKYCFTDDGMMLNAPPADCTLSHNGSVERLLMSNDQENTIKMMHSPSGQTNGIDFGVDTDYDKLSLTEIHSYLKVDSLAADHPLMTVMMKLKTVKNLITGETVAIDGVAVDIYRDDNLYLPRAGREVYLRIHLALMDSQKNIISQGSTPLTMNSSLAIYPREVGSFALLIANDLHLDLPYDSNTINPGDVVFHKFENQNAVNGPGLLFLSPVFINKDIYLPVPNADKNAIADDIPYSAVTFADRVVIGNGWVKTAEGQYTPQSAGSAFDRLWSDSKNFGGFQKGIENDGGADKGLQVLGKVVTGTYPDTTLMSKCISRSNNLSSMQFLSDTQLGVKDISNSSDAAESNFTYRAYFNKMNVFNAQEISSGVYDSSKWGEGKINFDENNSYTNVILDLSFSFGNKQIGMKLPFNSKVILTPEVGSAEAQEKLTNEVDNAKKSLDDVLLVLTDAQSTLSAHQTTLTQKESELALAEAQLANYNSSSVTTASTQGSPLPTPSSSPTTSTATTPNPSPTPLSYSDQQAKIADLQSQISALNTLITADHNTIENKQTIADNAQNSYDSNLANFNKYKLLVSIAPEITIQIEKLKSNKANLAISVKNAANLIDNNGENAAPVIKLKAYDNTYYNGVPINGIENNKLQGYLNFTFNESKTQLIPPSDLADTPATSTFTQISSDDEDWETLDQQCESARNAATSQSFGGASWDNDFSASTRHSWNFAGDESSIAGHDPALDKTWIFSSGNSPAAYNASLGWPDFMVKSIVKECIIESTASVVTGFFTCDSMIIQARQNPLRIIGSFIVGKLIIDPSAYTAGIVWSTIYHPQATRELRAIGVLHPSGSMSCDITSTTSPVWHPIPSAQELSNRMTCNSISLRAKADPFRWTSVDPDCGMTADTQTTQSNTICKHRLIRFYVVEQSREEGLTQ